MILHIDSGVEVKNSPANVGDVWAVDLMPWSGRSPGEGHGNPLQYSCLENSTEEPGRLQSCGHKESDITKRLTLSILWLEFRVTEGEFAILGL